MILIRLFSAALFCMLSLNLRAVVFDDFSANNSSWTSGGAAAAAWVSGGGPFGAGDAYVQNTSPLVGGHQVMNNIAQWSFDFQGAGVTEIQFYARTSFSSPIRIRAGVEEIGTGNKIVTLNYTTLPNDGQWHLLTLAVSPLDFDNYICGCGVNAVLINPVKKVRLYDSGEDLPPPDFPPAFGGVVTNAEIDYDKITYITGPVSTVTSTPPPSMTFSVTPTRTPSATRTESPTSTVTATTTASATPSVTPSLSPTASSTSTFTPTATPTSSPSGTFTATETFSYSPTALGTFTETPSSTVTASPSVTAAVSALPVSATLAVAPVPLRRGQNWCFGGKDALSSIDWRLYNTAAELVAQGSLKAQDGACVQSPGLGAGVYFIRIEKKSLGSQELKIQKIAIIP